MLPGVPNGGPLFCVARRPYVEPLARHDFGRMDAACKHCSALHWMAERLARSSQLSPKFSLCCLEGKIRLPPLEKAPQPLHDLLTSQDAHAVKFRTEISKYNRTFAFTSLGVNEDHSVNNGRGPPVFRISGELCHWSGALTPPNSQLARYAQLYLYEPQAALTDRVRQNADLDPGILRDLQAMLIAHHQYVGIYKHAMEILKQHNAEDVQVRLRLTPQLDRRRYNLPTSNEVAMILPGTSADAPRDIILRRRDGHLQRISDLHPAYTPLQYPLLFPRGENGWYPEMKIIRDAARQCTQPDPDGSGEDGEELNQDGSRRLTLTRYVSYRIHPRPNESSALLHGGHLFTQYIVDMFASIDQQRLRYLQHQQPLFRAARFNNLEDANMNDPDNLDLNDLGQRVFLPSSYTGGPRYMTQCYQDSMAVARYYRQVDIFLTMTTNPHWPEIVRELLPGQTAYDRPDIVARVFQMKKKELLELIRKHHIFGTSVAHIFTIEFQKRGLPHIHILIFLKEPYKLLTPAAVDSCISARWPDPILEPLLFETIKTCMVHGPCGTEKPNAICMVNGRCSKGYPKSFQEFTSMDVNGYPLYRRPNDERTYTVNGKPCDNRDIVPYQPFLSVHLNCHINIECAVSIGSIKYVNKYLFKGPDRGALEIEQKDEIKRWIDGQYISAPDAAWRIFQYPLHEVVPNIVRLQVHLPNHHSVLFNPHDDLQGVLQRGAAQQTTLTAFFAANADDGPLGHEARNHTYQEFPQMFVFNKSKKVWKVRERGFALGRMYFIKPTAGEVFYLRTLLTVVKGAKSFEDLRRVPGNPLPLPTFHAACLAHGLLEDDGEWRLCLQEAGEMHSGRQLRHLFVTLLLFGEPSQPDQLWMLFRDKICDDLEHQLHGIRLGNPITPDQIYDYGLFLINRLLMESGRLLSEWPSMPLPVEDWQRLTANSLITEQLAYDRTALQAELEVRVPSLNDDQRAAYDRITASVTSQDGQLFFLYGPGGSGKTYVYNTVCARVRGDAKIILCVSSSGISALLLHGGRTAHSMFKIPIDGLHDQSVCTIPKNSDCAELMRAASAIIWDEISAQHRLTVEAVDRTLRDLRGSVRPFGGLTVVLGGDFLQTLPVVPKGSREEVVDATVQRSPLWQHIEILRLRQNMRLDQANADTQQFAAWLLDVGHGRNMVDDINVRLPESMRVPDVNSLIQSIYPGSSHCIRFRQT